MARTRIAPPRLGRALIIALLPLALLTACTEDDPEPTSTDSPTAPEPTEPEPGQAWAERSRDGAAAFMSHWLDLFNSVRETGDTTDLSAASSRSCQVCQEYVKLTNEIYRAGGEITSRGWRVERLGFARSATMDRPRMALTIAQAPSIVRRSSDVRAETFPGGEFAFSAELAWKQGAWLMNRIEILE